MAQASSRSSGVTGDVDQLNLRIPVDVREFLEKLAGDDSKKLHPYIIELLEAHVNEHRARLIEIYRRDATIAEKRARALDQKAAAAERKNERAAASAVRKMESEAT